MDLIRLEGLRKYHKINPPVHMMIARYFGFGENEKEVNSESDLQSLMAMFPESPKA